MIGCGAVEVSGERCTWSSASQCAHLRCEKGAWGMRMISGTSVSVISSAPAAAGVIFVWGAMDAGSCMLFSGHNFVYLSGGMIF